MDINEIMIALCDGLGLPCAQDLYSGEEEKWVTFNYVDERPAQFSDNKARIECADIYVHLFTPLSFDYMELKRSLRDSLEENAFLVSSIQSYLEQDTSIRHTVFECEISQERSK